ncbi:uncharacterized protein [Ambystoma mexicanum]|uniref:uncharacterized protein n=1 Tax=Ambystoma mexicanum TaxID=8296 RepID=UPI0037E91F84
MPKVLKRSAEGLRKERFSPEDVNMLAETLQEDAEVVFSTNMSRPAIHRKKEIWAEVEQKGEGAGKQCLHGSGSSSSRQPRAPGLPVSISWGGRGLLRKTEQRPSALAPVHTQGSVAPTGSDRSLRSRATYALRVIARDRSPRSRATYALRVRGSDRSPRSRATYALRLRGSDRRLGFQRREGATGLTSRLAGSKSRQYSVTMSLQACVQWGSEDEPETRRPSVRPKSAKGRNRPPSIQPQGSLKVSTLGCMALEQSHTPERSRTAAEGREDTSQHFIHSLNVWKAKVEERDIRLGSGRTPGLWNSPKVKKTSSSSPLLSKDLNFTLPAKAPCTLNKYSILPSIGGVGEHPSRLQSTLCSEDSGA